MPQVRKLDPEEVKAYQDKGKGQRKITEEQYDSILADYEVGDYGEATLDQGENRLTVRNRMKAAATRRGIGVQFRRTTGDLIRFQVVEQSIENGKAVAEEPPVAISEPPAKPKGKGGRPKKKL